MFYLIGICHCIQFDGKCTLNREFISYLSEVVNKYRIEVIAEESSEDSLKKWSIDKTSVQKFSEDHVLKYIACDPNIDERKVLGIRSDEEIRSEKGLPKILNHEQLNTLDQEKIRDFPKREEFWLNKIKEYSTRPVIFICGSMHLNNTLRPDGFERLLSNNNLKYRLLKGFV
jgi:hypothetical protein